MWTKKFLRAIEHPFGRKIISALPEDMDVQVIGNALVTLGVPEDKVCGVLSLYSQIKPAGGIKDFLLDDNLGGFISIFLEEVESDEDSSDFNAKG